MLWFHLHKWAGAPLIDNFLFFLYWHCIILVCVCSVSSGIQNITELSDWRKEYTIVVNWIDMNEKKLAAQGEPGNQYKDLSNKCTTLDVSICLVSINGYRFKSLRYFHS